MPHEHWSKKLDPWPEQRPLTINLEYDLEMDVVFIVDGFHKKKLLGIPRRFFRSLQAEHRQHEEEFGNKLKELVDESTSKRPNK